MAQLDDDVGIVMQKSRIWVDDSTIVVFHYRNGTEVFTWPTRTDSIRAEQGHDI